MALIARSAMAALLIASVAGCSLRQASIAFGPTNLVELVRNSSYAVVGVADDRLQPQLDSPGVLGSGFRVEGTNLIVTAGHVVTALQGPPIVVWQGRRWLARLQRLEVDSDLALLSIDGAALPMPGLTLAKAENVAPGQWVLVLGCPFGTQPTATIGIVSALPGSVLHPAELRRRLQLNAAINAGNSGGPVLDMDGRVIAVANATVPGGYGLGFAVPIASVRDLLRGAISPVQSP